jgi:hypothetical protein
MKNYISCVLIIFSLGCSHLNHTITYSDLLHNDSGKVFITSEDSGLYEIRDKGLDSITGGYYSFYNNGHLQSYEYFVNMQVYNYDEEYDSLGNLIKTMGEPMTRGIVQRIAKDSINVKLYFFSLNKEYQLLHVKTMNNKTFDIILQDDTLYSNMQYAAFGLNFGSYEKIGIYWNVQYKNMNTDTTKTIVDSIILNFAKSGRLVGNWENGNISN